MDLIEINMVVLHSNHKLVKKLQMDEHHWRKENENYWHLNGVKVNLSKNLLILSSKANYQANQIRLLSSLKNI